MVVSRDDFDYQFGKLSAPEKERTLWDAHDFEAGDYYVYVEYNWATNSKDFVISAYGPGKVGIEKVDSIPEFLYDVYKSCALKTGK